MALGKQGVVVNTEWEMALGKRCCLKHEWELSLGKHGVYVKTDGVRNTEC